MQSASKMLVKLDLDFLRKLTRVPVISEFIRLSCHNSKSGLNNSPVSVLKIKSIKNMQPKNFWESVGKNRQFTYETSTAVSYFGKASPKKLSQECKKSNIFPNIFFREKMMEMNFMPVAYWWAKLWSWKIRKTFNWKLQKIYKILLIHIFNMITAYGKSK